MCDGRFLIGIKLTCLEGIVSFLSLAISHLNIFYYVICSSSEESMLLTYLALHNSNDSSEPSENLIPLADACSYITVVRLNVTTVWKLVLKTWRFRGKSQVQSWCFDAERWNLQAAIVTTFGAPPSAAHPPTKGKVQGSLSLEHDTVQFLQNDSAIV